jgi:GTPase-associated protein 1, N-terminal domain type 2/GTPase-associated protein 1, middle domain
VLLGQFTYTACDQPGPYTAVPGWKVKQAVSVASGVVLPEPAVRAAVQPFGTFVAPAVPSLTTLDDIALLPRCLRLDRLNGGLVSLAHLAAAGRDSTGRDAFFAHGLLVAITPAKAPQYELSAHPGWGEPRPADLWGAAEWLTPYQASAIEAAVVAGPPRVPDDSPLNPAWRADFLDLHPGQRLKVLAAAERVLTTPTHLVLVGLPVEAVGWLSMISHLLLPTVAWALPFSTYQTGSPPQAALKTGGKVIGIPPEDAAGWRRAPSDEALVCDPEDGFELTRGGFLLPNGDLLSVGPWAQLAEAVCTSGLEDVVRMAIDELSMIVQGAWDELPLAGLGVAVLRLPAETLRAAPQVASRAGDLVAEQLPVHRLPPALTSLVDVILRWSTHPVETHLRMLRTLDWAGAPISELVDRLLLGYFRVSLADGRAFTEGPLPWLPKRLQLSVPARQALLHDIDDLTAWTASAGSRARVRLVLTLASLAERIGLLSEETLLRQVVGERAATWVVPAALAGTAGLGPQPWPPVPRWIWSDVLARALSEELERRPVGAFVQPEALAWISEHADPLPAELVPGRTVHQLTAVDGERAAVSLLTRSPAPVTDPKALEVMRVAGFLRATLASKPRADAATAELHRWFATEPPRAAVLQDLVDRLNGRIPDAELVALGAEALSHLPPDETTFRIASILEARRSPAADPDETVVFWNRKLGHPAARQSGHDDAIFCHRQFGQPLPRTSRVSANRGTAAAAHPDGDEAALLDALVAGGLPGPLVAAALDRLVRWILLLPAEVLNFAANQSTFGKRRWLIPPAELLAQVQGRYSAGARTLVAGLVRDGKGDRRDADVLAADWVVRARMVEIGLAADPAATFFTGRPARGVEWFDHVRDLVGPDKRTPDEFRAWVSMARSVAGTASDRAGLDIRPDQDGAALIDGVVEYAERLTSLTSWFGRLRRS